MFTTVLLTEQVGTAVTLRTHIRKVPSSNIIQDTGSVITFFDIINRVVFYLKCRPVYI
jgi:hypothetical protein